MVDRNYVYPRVFGVPAGFVRNEMSHGDCQEND